MATSFSPTHAGRLDAILAMAVPELSRSRAAALIAEGCVTVNGVVVRRVSTQVLPSATVTVDIPAPRPAEAFPEDLPIQIVYQDDDIAVIDKAAGMVVHPSLGHDSGTLVHALLFHIRGLSGVGGVERPGIVHRLDRGTSGLIVVAKNDVTHWSLADQFATHSAGRRYLALTLAVPREGTGTLRSSLARHVTDRIRWASSPSPDAKPAVTHWSVLGRGQLGLMACELETGRTHQIRVHLTEAGWPLAGDDLYKRRGILIPSELSALAPEGRPMLHAWQLHLNHPATGERMVFRAVPPPDFQALCLAAGLETALINELSQ